MACLPYTTNLTCWLRSRALPLDQDADVGNWYDDTDGGSKDFAQAVAGLCPHFKHNVVNRRPGLLCDGADDVLVGPASSGLVAASAKMAFVAFRPTAFTSNNAAPGSNDGVFVMPGCGFTVRANGGSPLLYVFNDDGGGAADAVSFSIAANTTYVAGMWHNGTTLYAALNSMSTLDSIASGATADLTPNAQIGKAVGNYWFTGYVFEIATFNAFVSPANADTSVANRLMEYFASEWLDRGDPQAMATDRAARRLWAMRSPQEQAALSLPAAGLDHNVGAALGIADYELPMPTGINPAPDAVEPWRNDALIVTQQTIVFADEGGQ